jgi:hypothetical protein
MENNKSISAWIKIEEVKDFYLFGLDKSYEMKMLFGEESLKDYKCEQPSLIGFIKYFRDFKLPGFNTAIIGKNNIVIKIAYGKD